MRVVRISPDTLPLTCEALAEEFGGVLAVDDLDRHRVTRRIGERDGCGVGVGQLACESRDEHEAVAQIGATKGGGRDFLHRGERGLAPPAGLVQSSVFDCDSRRRG